MSRVFHYWFVLCLLLTQGTPLSAQSAANGLTLISSEGRQTVRTVRTRQRDMVVLDDLADVFGLQVEQDASSNTATVSYADDVIILTADQQLVSVAGRLVSLRAAPRRANGQWLVPVDFLDRALASILVKALELRQRSRLVLIGNVHVPRVTGQYRAHGGGGQLSLAVIPSTAYEVAQDGGRLVVSFEADALDLERLPIVHGDLVAGISLHPSSAELLVDLGPLFDSFSVSDRVTSSGDAELVINLTASAPAIDAGQATTLPSPNPSLSADVDVLPDLRLAPTVRVVAIDAGHGGDDEGTRGSDSTLEKNITLSVTQRLSDAIAQRLGLRVVLTRSGDDNVPLDARAAVANNNKADLFISLHVNSSIRPSATGAEVFYLSIDEYGEEARALAQRDVQLVPMVGGGMRTVDFVLWEMAQVQYLERSARLANIVQQELSRRIPMSTREVQEAPFRVLVGANMPAVLIEMGFISNPEDERRLTSTRFQNAVVDALVDSVLRFRSYVEAADEP